MYLDHLQNWSVQGHSLLIFLIVALFWLSETGKIWDFRAFPGERVEEWPDIRYAAVSWPPSKLVRLWLRSGDFSNFGAFSGNPLKKWPEISHAAVSWLSELIKLWLQFVDFSHFDAILNLKWVKLGVSRHFGRVLWIFLIMATLWLKLVIFGVSGHYLENVWEKMSIGGRRHNSDALRPVLSSFIGFQKHLVCVSFGWRSRMGLKISIIPHWICALLLNIWLVHFWHSLS